MGLTHSTKRELEMVREYRTRLIADVVTGKFDVREAAARLPDEVEELEPLDEADTLIDGEEEPTDALATAQPGPLCPVAPTPSFSNPARYVCSLRVQRQPGPLCPVAPTPSFSNPARYDCSLRVQRQPGPLCPVAPTPSFSNPARYVDWARFVL